MSNIKQINKPLICRGEEFEIYIEELQNNSTDIVENVVIDVEYSNGLEFVRSSLNGGSYNDSSKKWIIDRFYPEQNLGGSLFYFRVVDDCQVPFTITFKVLTCSACGENSLCYNINGLSCCALKKCNFLVRADDDINQSLSGNVLLNDSICTDGTTLVRVISGSEIGLDSVTLSESGDFNVVVSDGVVDWQFEYELICVQNGIEYVFDTATVSGSLPTANAVDVMDAQLTGNVSLNDTVCTSGTTVFRLISGSEVNGAVNSFAVNTGQYEFTQTDIYSDWSFQYEIICVIDGVEYPQNTATVSGLGQPVTAEAVDDVNAPLTGTVITNDILPPIPYTIEPVMGSMVNGSVVLNTDGTYTFTPTDSTQPWSFDYNIVSVVNGTSTILDTATVSADGIPTTTSSSISSSTSSSNSSSSSTSSSMSTSSSTSASSSSSTSSSTSSSSVAPFGQAVDDPQAATSGQVTSNDVFCSSPDEPLVATEFRLVSGSEVNVTVDSFTTFGDYSVTPTDLSLAWSFDYEIVCIVDGVEYPQNTATVSGDPVVLTAQVESTPVSVDTNETALTFSFQADGVDVADGECFRVDVEVVDGGGNSTLWETISGVLGDPLSITSTYSNLPQQINTNGSILRNITSGSIATRSATFNKMTFAETDYDNAGSAFLGADAVQVNLYAFVGGNCAANPNSNYSIESSNPDNSTMIDRINVFVFDNHNLSANILSNNAGVIQLSLMSEPTGEQNGTFIETSTGWYNEPPSTSVCNDIGGESFVGEQTPDGRITQVTIDGVVTPTSIPLNQANPPLGYFAEDFTDAILNSGLFAVFQSVDSTEFYTNCNGRVFAYTKIILPESDGNFEGFRIERDSTSDYAIFQIIKFTTF